MYKNVDLKHVLLNITNIEQNKTLSGTGIVKQTQLNILMDINTVVLHVHVGVKNISTKLIH